jgi:hypothetical protein
MSYVDAYAEMMRAKGRPFALVDGQLFTLKDHWIAPAGPAAQAYRLDSTRCREVFRKLGGLWIMWTDGFGPHAADSEWYAVICRKHRPIEDIPDPKRRSELRRALRECDVRKVDVTEIAEHGFPVYAAAHRHYRNATVRISSEQEYRRRIMTDSPFGNCRHQWGVYCDNKLVAFAQNLIYDKTEVNYTQIKLHPLYLDRYPAYALLYTMNEYYLAQQQFDYVSDGFRTISHETGIQEFLIKKFGFEKAKTGLHIHFRPPFGQLLRMAQPFRPLAESLCPKMKALFELNRLRLR